MRFKKGDDTVPARQAGKNVKTLGDTLARIVAGALYDIRSSKSKGPDT